MAATKTEKAYAAGLIDGEGCICINYNKPTGLKKYGQFYPMVTVHITDVNVLKWLQSIWGGSIKTRKKGEEHWKPSYDWKIQSTRAIEFIQEIQPYMIIKSDEAVAFLTFNTLKSGSKISEKENMFRFNLKQTLSTLKKGIL